MKKIFFVLSMLLTVGLTYCANAQDPQEPARFVMPGREVLTERLQKLGGMEHFLEKSNLIDQLAGQEKVTVGVVIAVELSLYDYTAGLPGTMQVIMQQRKPQIIYALLEGNDSALKEAHETLDAVNAAIAQDNS